MKSNIKTQPAKEGFNNEKTVIHILNINKTDGKNVILGAY